MQLMVPANPSKPESPAQQQVHEYSTDSGSGNSPDYSAGDTTDSSSELEGSKQGTANNNGKGKKKSKDEEDRESKSSDDYSESEEEDRLREEQRKRRWEQQRKKMEEEQKRNEERLKERERKHLTNGLLRVLITSEDSSRDLKELLKSLRTTESEIQEIIEKDRRFCRSQNKVSLYINLSICNNYMTPEGCSKKSCNSFHICPKYVVDLCMDGRCEMGHDMNRIHNRKLLKRLQIEKADSIVLKQLKKETVVAPDPCNDYNVDGNCNQGNQCIKLHLCVEYIMGTCEECPINHEILDPQCAKLLKQANVNLEQTSAELKCFLKGKWLFNVDGILRRKRAREEEVKRIYHADEDEGGVDIPQVCMALLDGTCQDAENGRCKKLHANKFPSPHRKEQVSLEEFNPDELHVIKRKQLRELFTGNAYEADFINMKLKDSATNVTMDLRRLSTESAGKVQDGMKHATKWLWYYKDGGGAWVEYGSGNTVIASADIEREFSTSEGKKNMTSDVGGDHYEFDFQRMLEKSTVKGIQIEREIRRRPAPPPFTPATPGVYKHIPPHWDPMKDTETVKLVPLVAGSDEFQRVKQLMGGLNVQKVTRIQNPYLWEMYQNKKLVYLKKYKNDLGKVNEMNLFHGTAANNIPSICEQNFDWRFHGTAHGSSYGQGTYFGTAAQTSVGYARQGAGIFVAKVLVGLATQGNATMTKPPPGFDSTHGPSMIIKYHDQDVYPEYLVEF
ncbi:unnamed protein product [Darwinula stevensoni]|uniref:Poly [ADP-ribose] polymerase n=1 Tax=Darwinula stevensoni TaxID=69355 RepID=A0A7R8X783_9CRUS|nr:unnamed protein product [Darwinula stevensoni]CAG0882936.1 unnamed protein product [Darwinula stevensoni]